jgi:ATPase subunit of ABC transporter with duplicated ATPase domains
MSSNLEAFKAEQDHLLSAYQRLPELGEQWLSKANISAKQIEQWHSELSANRFKLCVAGQMNSGKSTLINALLFGRIVLPVLGTVMTSTITLIEHVSQHPSSKEGARVEFYSQDEWANLRHQMTSDEKNDEKFQAAVTQAREVGVLAACRS